MSGRYPGGANSPELLWDLLDSRRDGVSEARGDRWDPGWHHPDPSRPGRVYTRAGGFLDRIDEFDADFFGLSPREARQVDPQQRLLLELAWEAFEHAGLAPRAQAGSKTGVFVGISSNDYSSLVGPGWPDAYSNTGSAFSIAANRVSYIFDLHGPSVAVDTACSSSLVCVHQACRALLAGECTTALAGGVSLIADIRPWQGFAKASMLSPDGRCKSFDATGNGYVRSEGGGLVLLKPLAAAERDGDRILGVILASGVNSDGRTMGLSMPNGDAQEALLRTVYASCGVEPEDVFYVEAHGTGTAVGDPIECGALGRVLGAPRRDDSRCLIGSVKSNIGHLEAASGIAGLTKVLLALQHRSIPGNLHFNEPNPKIDFDNWKLDVVTATTALPSRERPLVIGVNSFGFGGTNAHLAVQEYRQPASAQAALPPDVPSVLLLSGASDAALRDVASTYREMLRSAECPQWNDVCAAAATTRSPLKCRLAVYATSNADAAARLDAFLSDASTPRLATGEVLGKTAPVAFVYSGNGPQWWGMGRELLAEHAGFRASIESVDAVFAPLAGWSLLDEMRRPEAESRMERTEIAQPMLFAMQVGLTRVLRESGIDAAAVLGHSVGEVAAAWASGALSLEQATLVIYHRSREQATTAGSGRMAAVGVSRADAEVAMADIDGWLEVAAVNAPNAVTIAGDPVALERVVQSLTAAGKFARVLALDYPFHTKAMDPIRPGLVRSLAGLAPSPTWTTFVSTVDGAPKPGPELDADYWFRNVREPVLFDQAVTHLIKDGVTLFIELGPHPVLKDYVMQSARAADAAVVALQTLRRPGTKGPESDVDNLWTSVCAALAGGANDPAALFTRPAPAPSLPLYPWQRSRHWRGSVALPGVPVAIAREHALLGHRVYATDGVWENTLDLHQLTYLRDHRVQGAVVFPAAGYVDLALEAARLLYGAGPLDLDDFEVLRPLAIPAQVDPIVQTFVDARDGVVEVRSRQELYANDWIVHVRARLSRAHAPVSASRELADLIARTPHTVTAAEHYGGTARRGLEYGPAFQGVARVGLTEPDAPVREALAEISLPELADVDAYLAHPGLLDSCVQVLVTLIGQNETRPCSTIPVFLGRVRSIAPLTTRMWCHVVMRRESERSAVADFCVMDVDGRVLLTIDEARCQKIDFTQAATAPFIAERWRPDPSSARPSSSALPAPSTIAAAVAGHVARLGRDAGRLEFYAAVQPGMHRLAGAYAVCALAELAGGLVPFDVPTLARKGGVRRDQMALLTTLIRFAEEDQAIQAGSAGWQWTLTSQPDAAGMWRTLFQQHPRYQAEWQLLLNVGDSLVARLRGDAPADTAALLDQLHDTAPFQAPYNDLLSASVQQLVERWPSGRPIRVLELRGASAALSSTLLSVLPTDRTDYVFTDPSDTVLGRAEHRLSRFEHVRFLPLDLTQGFREQFAAHHLEASRYFDLVLCSGMLTSPEHASELLAEIRSVLAPDGHVLLLQPGADRFSTLVLGMHTADWTGALADASFDDVVCLDDVASGTGLAAQQRIIVAAAGVDQVRPEVPSAARDLGVLLVVEPRELTSYFVRALQQSLEHAGARVIVHVGEPGADAAVLTDVLARAHAERVVYLTGLSNEGGCLTEQTRRTTTLLRLVRALESTRAQVAANLTVVTRGAFPTADGRGPIDPGHASLWGLGRVVGNEHTALDIRLVDLHAASGGASAAGWLATELLARDAESEVQIVDGHRYVNRAHLTTADTLSHARAGAAEAFTLDFRAQGGLDSLHLRTMERRAPDAHEVEIAVRAAGLNFRDVLWAMGMLPEEAVERGFSGPTIGMECAGVVVRVGARVGHLAPGDRVVAFASSCFASHVTTDAMSVARIPHGLDFDAAATIPTAFLTAYYALDYLARVQPGETILIHGAAGGVGMAAIQIAKLKGAVVIGTAGSARKRRMLEMLGVDHTLNSRSLEFADEVMRLTGGLGVDIVLNSLAGEAITKSLECLRPFGRFLEIGKRDLYANSRIGLRPFRNNLSYFGIDADTLLIERADLARSVFQTVIGHFERGELRPLPFQAIPISRADEAFRAMQQSRHVGKLVVSVRTDDPALRVTASSSSVSSAVFRPDATYVVTGGLGGFGLSTARWLVEQGARSLALLGRRGAATDEARAGLAAMEAMGARVRAFAVDVADAPALEQALAVIRSEMPALGGVIHSAALIEDAPIMNLEPDQVERVYAPKLLGAWNLHVATLGDALDLFVLYSSSSAMVGNPGQGAYVAANMYLDALALYRRSIGLPALSVGWGAIRDAGFLTRHQQVADMLKSRTGLDATPAVEALADLGRLLAAGAIRVSVGRFDLQRLGQMLPGARVPRFLPLIPKHAADAALGSEDTLVKLLEKTPAGERRELVLARVRDHGARVLGTSASQISLEQPLAELGLDSLMAVELAGGLERDLGQPLSVMQVLGAGSLAAIAQLAMKILGLAVDDGGAASSAAPVQARA